MGFQRWWGLKLTYSMNGSPSKIGHNFKIKMSKIRIKIVRINLNKNCAPKLTFLLKKNNLKNSDKS